jgi:branched-chain amino acid transport system substrate-binding protein
VKKVLFLLFTCLVLVALVIPACGPGGGVDLGIPEGAKTIKVGIIGPMQYIEGENHWHGAIMAAQKINAEGGFKVGDETYYVDLIQADSNETISTTDAAAAMEKLITVDKAQYVMGGFRTESVAPMQEIAMDNKTIFLDCGAATLSLCGKVKQDYDRYKYFFRNTPFASNYLVDNTLLMVGMAGAILKEDTGIKRPLKVAVVAEGAEWADGMVNALNALIPSRLHMDVVGVWRPSPTATELTAEMTAIQSADADIICTTISGPLGIPYARSWGELKVPAASVGINVEAQNLGFWDATNGFGNYDTTQATYCVNAGYTDATLPFVNEFMQRYGVVPNYTAGTYDAMYCLTQAITRAGKFDSDSVVAELEKTDVPDATGAYVFRYTGMDAPLGNPHDVLYGPGFSTGMASQWQNGELLGVWPNPAYATSDEWKAVDYPGIVKWMAPPLVVDKLKAEAATEPAAPPEEEQPAAPPAEQPAAAATSFAAATYTNDAYGFSFQYPKDWVERPELITTPYHLAAFGVSGFVPGVIAVAFDTPYPETKEGVVQSYTDMKNQSPKLLSDIKETTLADGSQAYTYKVQYISASGYESTACVLDTVRDGKQIRIYTFTIDAFSPYDVKLCQEIDSTITFK